MCPGGEPLSCPACGGDRARDLTDPPRAPGRFAASSLEYRLHCCLDCGSEFAEPRTPAPAGWYPDVDEYYGWRWEFDRALADLSGRPGIRKVLEIGCGEGALLERLATRYRISGVDLNAEAVARARRRNLPVDRGTFCEFAARHPGERFDAILFFHVLEHVEDPLEFLASVTRLLEPNGMVVLSVPNERRLSLLVRREGWDHPPHHLTRFSRAGMERLLARAGLRVVSIRDEPLTESSLRQSGIRANEVLRRLGLGEPMSWPKILRIAAKLPIVPFLLVRSTARRGERGTYTGVSLYVVAQRAGKDPPA